MSKEEQTNHRMGKELWEQSCIGDIQKILHLLKNGAPINWRDSSDEWTALHRACFYNCPAIVEVLLKYKPNINHMTHVGDTALHLSCRYGHMECVKLLLSTNECNLEITNTLGRSPLGDAVYTKKLDVIKFFIVEYHVDINGPITNFGETILQLPVRLEMLDVIEFLITAVDVKGLKESLFEVVIREGTINTIKWVLSELNVLEVNLQNPITKSGDTLLGLAIREGRIEVVEYAFMFTSLDLQQKLISASMYVTKSGDTLLGLAIRTGQLDIIKFLVTKLEMDEKSCITESGDTPLVLAVREGKLNVIKYLVTERFFAADDAHLFLACEYGHTQIVDYLLTDHQLNPNALNVQQISPLSLTKKKEIIKLLLQHGANAKDVYTDHRKSLGKMFTKDPLKSPVKMFVIGDGGEGKSTLIEALEHEPTFKTSFASIFVTPKEVDGVSQNTAGIIPRVFKSRLYGDVQFYDFAGQETYYSSHAAIIKSVIDTCPPIFVLVLGLHRTDEAITHSICYWLGIIANQCANLEEKAPLIIVGSHADLIPKTEAKRIKIIVMKTVQNFALFNLVDIIPLDCRYSNSDELKLLRHCVGNICTFIRSKLSVSLNSHMFLIYLLDKHSNKLAVSLEEVQAQIETNVKQDLDLSATHILAFIPTSITRLVDICHQLCDKGHILFQFNKSFPEKSVIIIDKAALLSEINGTMFAPENFRQHCQLSTSTGVVPQSKLAEHFPKFDIEMLSDFLFHLELAVPIEDVEVLSLINQRLTKASEAATSPEKSYIFCPALIQIEVPHKVFVHQETLLYHFGWVLSCIHKEHFFDARFLHVLILRLALSLGLAPVVDPSIPALQRQCFVWKTGVCWKTPQGAAVLVEVVDKKKVMVLLQSNNVSFDLLKLRTTLIRKVVETSHEFCSSIVTEELLLSPTDVTYPLKFSSTLPLYSLKSLAQSIVQQEPFVVSIKGTEQLPVSVLEVYANLGENILQPLFNQNDPIHNNKISDRALLHLCRCWSKNSQLLDIICSAISSTTCVSSEANIEVALRAWRDGCDGTYRALRLFVDSFSVFAGKNLIDLAGVPYKKFVEDLLPLSNPIVSPLTSTGGGLGGLTIEDLKEKTGITDSQLDTKLIDLEQELHKLADCFDNVETYLGKLGLTAGQQNDVKQIAYRQNTNIAMAEALRLWLQPNPFVAIIRALLEILLDLDKGDVALQVCHAVHQLTKSSGVLQ